MMCSRFTKTSRESFMIMGLNSLQARIQHQLRTETQHLLIKVTTCYSHLSVSLACPQERQVQQSVNGLFNEYWSGYYDELYHTDTRIFSVECLLNNNDISNFLFTDIIVIENSEFRVNNINYSSEGLSRIELIKLP